MVYEYGALIAERKGSEATWDILRYLVLVEVLVAGCLYRRSSHCSVASGVTQLEAIS